jgi:hypothetical protein
MSLINDALKKAARLRAEEQGDVVPPMPGGGHRRHPGQRAPVRTQTVVLVGGAAVALIVVSAVITGILMTGRTETKPVAVDRPAPAAPTPAPVAKLVVQAPPVAVSLPRLEQPAPASAPAVVVKPAPVQAPSPKPSPVIEVPAQERTPAAAAPLSHSEAVQGIVDGYRVSGVRSAGADSKALIDGHVYKVNDVIDRTLGIRLVKVDPDHLTLVDKDGATYVKSF